MRIDSQRAKTFTCLTSVGLSVFLITNIEAANLPPSETSGAEQSRFEKQIQYDKKARSFRGKIAAQDIERAQPHFCQACGPGPAVAEGS